MFSYAIDSMSQPTQASQANIKMSCFLSPSLIDGGYCSYPHTLNSLLFTP